MYNKIKLGGEAMQITEDFIEQIMSYVLWGTIAIGVIFLIVFTIFIVKSIRYHCQMKSNEREKRKILKAYEIKKSEILSNSEN